MDKKWQRYLRRAGVTRKDLKRVNWWMVGVAGGGHQSREEFVDEGLHPAVQIHELDVEGAPHYEFDLLEPQNCEALLEVLRELAMAPYRPSERILIAPSVKRVSYTVYVPEDYEGAGGK